ncbi:MAG: formimidoylglutamase [Phycisphaerales bacterium]|nr:formimidoylglutamase [Phycisphaerales bacterium]
MTIRNTQRPEWPDDLRSSRLASTFKTETPDGCQIGLLGVPDDTGVRMNHGRPGAAQGPRGLRAALAAYGALDFAGGSYPSVFDAGDVKPGDSLEETHQRVTEAATDLLDAGLLPIAIGGGHDLTFPFVRALAQKTDGRPVGVYFDAHLDVRDEPGSGMSFRRLVEECGVKELYVYGLDPAANATEHMDWFASHGGRMDPFGPDDEWPQGELFVSFDLDVIDQAFAPGVSAMNPAGWSAAEACRWAHASGRCPRVRCFDIMELAPPLDETGRTARLAARLLLEFLRGYSERRG